jgi:glyoxylase-like metal-dependent hydrolase (beta-lactamase superfamily II)
MLPRKDETVVTTADRMSTNAQPIADEVTMKKIAPAMLALAVFCLGIVSLAQVVARQTPMASTKQAPGFYRGYLGRFEVTALSDGAAPRNLEEILSNPGLVRQLLAEDHLSEPMAIPINAYLINSGSHLVLIDTGAGELFGPTSGFLISNLKEAGYQPQQIDIILLTHIHGDHSGGLSIAGVRQFPNATVYVDQHDLEYFVTRRDSSDESETLRRQVEQSRATVDPYLKANRVVTIKQNGEVIPGISSSSQPGHTPGHTAYLVQSEGHAILFWGDIIHSSEVQFVHPEVRVAYDVEPREAAQTRLREFQFATEREILVGSDHISFPGLGHIRKVGSTYNWVPIKYATTVTELDPKP